MGSFGTLDTGLTEILFGVKQVIIFSEQSGTIINVDATLSEEHTSDAEVTDHPIEKGADITDHIRKKPAQVKLTGVISNTPLEFFSFDTGGNAEAAWDALQNFQRDQVKVNIITTLQEYENMALVSLSCPRDANRGNIIEFTATFREIITVESETVAQPDTPRPPKVKIGNKATGAATAAKRESLFAAVLGIFGG